MSTPAHGHRIFIVAADASGDLHAAQMVRAARRAQPKLTFYGIGGSRMRGEGVRTAFDSAPWSAMGWVQSFRVAFPLLCTYRALRLHLRRQPPAAVVLVDFGAFNARLGRWMRRWGIPTFYFMPPGSWNRRYGRTRELAQVADRFATPFPWHADALREAGADAHYVGHPILDQLPLDLPRSAARAQLGIAGDGPVVLLLPGSRRQEIRFILPPMLSASRLIAQQRPDVRFVLAPAMTVPPELVADAQHQAGTAWPQFSGRHHVCMRAADVALAASGTVTLELACMETPTVVVYCGAGLDRIQYALVRRRIRRVALPNIIVERTVVPELLAEQAHPANQAHHVLRLLADPQQRMEQLRGFRDVRAAIGEPGAAARAAALLIDLLENVSG